MATMPASTNFFCIRGAVHREMQVFKGGASGALFVGFTIKIYRGGKDEIINSAVNIICFGKVFETAIKTSKGDNVGATGVVYQAVYGEGKNKYHTQVVAETFDIYAHAAGLQLPETLPDAIDF